MSLYASLLNNEKTSMMTEALRTSD